MEGTINNSLLGNTVEERGKVHIWVAQYLKKIAALDWPEPKVPPAANLTHIFWAWIASFIAIFIVMSLDRWANLYLPGASEYDAVFCVAPLGATAVLVYQAILSPLAQPRNTFFGNVIGGFCGVSCYKIMGSDANDDLRMAFAAAMAVSFTIVLQQVFNCVHPPGGAISLAAVINGERVTSLGYWYLLFPVATSSLILIAVALLINNIATNRRYPLYY